MRAKLCSASCQAGRPKDGQEHTPGSGPVCQLRIRASGAGRLLNGLPQVIPDSRSAKACYGDEHPARHRQPQELPDNIGTFARSFEYHAQCIAEREIFEHVVQAGAARRDFIRRQILQSYMPSRDTGTRSRNDSQRCDIDAAAPPGRIMQRRNKKHDTNTNHRDTLQNAQRARIE